MDVCLKMPAAVLLGMLLDPTAHQRAGPNLGLGRVLEDHIRLGSCAKSRGVEIPGTGVDCGS